MTDSFFFDNDGPITGKIPVQVSVYGDGDEPAARAACDQAFATFLTDVRLGGLAQAKQTFIVPGVCSAIFTHSFGVTTVDLYLVDKGDEEEEFFGGIVLKLVTKGARFDEHIGAFQLFFLFDGDIHPSLGRIYNSVSSTDLSSRLSLDGCTQVPAQLAGMPALPQGAGNEAWVVVWARRGVSLVDRPVERGAVKFKTLFVSPGERNALVETSTKKKFLLQASVITGDARTVGGWTLGRVPRNDIPPLVLPPTAEGFVLGTYGWEARTVAEAERTKGLVFVACTYGLYACTPGDAAWSLLASTSPSGGVWNVFAPTITESTTDASVNLACTGTNFAGECSSFEVTITSTSAGRTVSGSIALAPVAVVWPDPPPADTTSNSGSWTNSTSFSLASTTTTYFAGKPAGPDMFYPRTVPGAALTTVVAAAAMEQSAAGSSYSCTITATGETTYAVSCFGSSTPSTPGATGAFGRGEFSVSDDKWFYTAFDRHGFTQATVCRYEGPATVTNPQGANDIGTLTYPFFKTSALFGSLEASAQFTSYGQRTVKAGVVKGGVLSTHDVSPEYGPFNLYVSANSHSGTLSPYPYLPSVQEGPPGTHVVVAGSLGEPNLGHSGRLNPNPIYDCVLADMRHQCYVRQRFWLVEAGETPRTSQDLVIGNDVDEVPLIDALNAWFTANGADPVTSLYVHPDTPTVSLL